jgi:hypothetical protein
MNPYLRVYLLGKWGGIGKIWTPGEEIIGSLRAKALNGRFRRKRTLGDRNGLQRCFGRQH